MSGEPTQYVLDLAATHPVVISDTEAVYLYGLDFIAQQQTERAICRTGWGRGRPPTRLRSRPAKSALLVALTICALSAWSKDSILSSCRTS